MNVTFKNECNFNIKINKYTKIKLKNYPHTGVARNTEGTIKPLFNCPYFHDIHQCEKCENKKGLIT